MPELFISYSRDDTARMEPIAENLRQLGFDLWIDIEHLTPGTPDWFQAVDEALQRADGLVAFLSPVAHESEWVQREIQRARNFGKPIYPVLLRGDRRTSIPFILTGTQYADMRGRANREGQFEKLVQTLARELNHPVPDYDLVAKPGQLPTVNIVQVTGYVEGNVYALNVGGDVSGDVNVAGNSINHHQSGSDQMSSVAEPPPSTVFDATTSFRNAVQARQANDHEAALALLKALARKEPEFLPEQVAQLVTDSQARVDQMNQRDAYRERYDQIALLAIDPMMLDDARLQWASLRADFPDMNDDPDGLAKTLESPEPELERSTRLTDAVLAVLPEPFEWCKIPAGRVTLKDDAGTHDVQPFFMAKYLITYEQFQVFVDDEEGLWNDEWWQDLAADRETREAPEEQYYTYAEHLPRDNISWYEAVAFCRWLSEQARLDIRLPTEWEWQWAAQGLDGRDYPWGNTWDPDRANVSAGVFDFLESESTPVTRYEEGASPYGVLDMSGNVCEWCLNEDWIPSNTLLGGDANRAVRDGSFMEGKLLNRVFTRTGYPPDKRKDFIGFRVACFS